MKKYLIYTLISLISLITLLTINYSFEFKELRNKNEKLNDDIEELIENNIQLKKIIILYSQELEKCELKEYDIK